MGIQFKNVNFIYKDIANEQGALLDINLDINTQGEFIAILGHTGSGKTTLVQHMNALIQPSSGQVSIFGVVLPNKKRPKINFLRQKVGLVFQFPEYQLFEKTIIEDIAFGPRNFKSSKEESLQKAKKAAQLVGIDESLYNQSPFRISGGQMRRVAIAGILAMEPEILVLDEPTRGLDPQGKEEIMELFNDIHQKENKSIVLISHDMDVVARYAKRAVVLDNGKIVYDGPIKPLFEHPDFAGFHLDYPTPLKIMKHLSKQLNIPYKPLFTLEEILEYVRSQV